MIDRRDLLSLVAVGAGVATAGRAAAQVARMIPQRPSARVIVDNDFAGDPDGLAALAHQLLTPKTRVTLVTSSAVDPKLADAALAGRSAAAGRDTALELIRRAGISQAPPVVAGAERFAPGPSPAARAIVAEAIRDDPLPLIVTCGGPLTNIAAALRLAPRIATRMTLIWIGGGGYPAGGWEYNLAVDAAAARYVVEESRVPLWQVPQPAYRQMQVSIAALGTDLRPISPFTRWLYDQFTAPPPFVTLGGTWPLGDSPLVLLSAISTESSHYADLPARRIGDEGRYGAVVPGRMVRVFDQLDARLTFDDFYALLRLNVR